MGNLCTNSQSQMTRESLAQGNRNEVLSRKSHRMQGAGGTTFDQQFEQDMGGRHKPSKDQTYPLYELNQQNISRGENFQNRSHNKSTNFTNTRRYSNSNHPKYGPSDAGNRVMTRYTYGNGDHYEGEVLVDRRDIRDGEGIFYCANKQKRTNYEYHGEWKQNLREGHGHCYYYNEDLYVGQWKADRRHGMGELFTRKQDRYKGQWKNDMRDGKGTLTSSNNSVFTGKWYQDKKHGLGEMTGQDKQVFVELWKYGVLVTRTKKQGEEGDKSLKLEEPMRAADDSLNQTGLLGQTLSLKDTLDQSAGGSPIVHMLTEIPQVSCWTEQNVQEWIQRSGLSQIEGLVDLFKNNRINGARLLTLTQSELQGELFNIKSLGRCKKIIRAVKFLKANVCRTRNTSLLQSTVGNSRDFQVNRSQGSLRGFNHNRSNLYMASIDKSAILSSAQSFFQKKARGQIDRNKSRFQYLDSFNSSFRENFRNTQVQNYKRANSLLVGNRSLQHECQEGFDIQDQNSNYVAAPAAADTDPESSMALGQDAGLIGALGENGFNFFIDFKELLIDPKSDLIGRGGYGDVFKARWLGTRVAVKKFGKRYMTRKALKDFIKEIEMLNQLRHPNIVLYMGVSIDFASQSYFYMITEFVSKGSLFDLLHQRKIVLDDARITKVAKQIAIALLYLQSRQLFHCDLKSQNVLINDDWTVKLCDFGLSRYQTKFDADNHGKIGTPHWMAPEILRGEKYSSAADVYSFGVILWEMLTLDIPFKGRSIPHITGMVGYYRETLKVPPQCNKNLRKIVNNCLLHEPERRPKFEHIVEYLTKIEQDQRHEDTVSPAMVNKLLDFLY